MNKRFVLIEDGVDFLVKDTKENKNIFDEKKVVDLLNKEYEYKQKVLEILQKHYSKYNGLEQREVIGITPINVIRKIADELGVKLE